MRKRKHALAALVVAIAATAVALAAGVGAGSAKSSAAFKVAWIYVGPHNDAGWSQAHNDGRLYVQKTLGSKVQTTYKENIAVGAQLQQTVASLVNQGYKMIFGTSYGYFDKALAAKYPQVDFEQATGTDTAKNLSEYFGAAEDTVFLSGMAAGAATKSGTIGYVVAYPIPEVIRHANAFALGAQLMHPGAKVKLVWTNSWFDPAKEKKAAQALHAAGADVLGQNVDSPATGQFAQSKHVPWVGYDANAANPNPATGGPAKGGWAFYDVKDPANPVKLGEFVVPQSATHGFEIDDRYLYGCASTTETKKPAGTAQSLTVVDYSDPKNPTQVSVFHIQGQFEGESYAGDDMKNPDGTNQIIQCHEVNKDGNRLWVAWRDAGIRHGARQARNSAHRVGQVLLADDRDRVDADFLTPDVVAVGLGDRAESHLTHLRAAADHDDAFAKHFEHAWHPLDTVHDFE